MLASQAVFLRNASQTEGLTRKTCAKNVEGLNRRDIYLSYVAVRTITEVCLVRLLGKLVPVTRKNALSTSSLKCEAKTTDPTEQINKSKLFLRVLLQRSLLRIFANDLAREHLL